MKEKQPRLSHSHAASGKAKILWYQQFIYPSCFNEKRLFIFRRQNKTFSSTVTRATFV
jgi:hypothetical protein